MLIGIGVWIHTGTNDLLQAYWKVACMVAKEGLNEEHSKENKEI
jgi:hypothetical protein